MRVPTRKGGEFTNLKPDPYITQKKFDELVLKLKKLKLSQPRLAQEVSRLAEGGDFSENAGYQAAKWQLRGLNQRILDLDEQLKFAIIIKPSKDKKVVSLGSSVTIRIDGKEKTYMILGSAEIDLAKNIISHHSPIGQALLNKKVGEIVKVQLGDKETICEIMKVE